MEKFNGLGEFRHYLVNSKAELSEEAKKSFSTFLDKSKEEGFFEDIEAYKEAKEWFEIVEDLGDVIRIFEEYVFAITGNNCFI